MPTKYSGNDYFARQQRLADQEEEAMRNILKIRDMEPKREQSYDRKGEGGTKTAPMPGVTYDEGNIVDNLLDFLKIKPRQKRFTKPKPAGRSGFI